MGKTHITIEYMVKRKRKWLSRSVLAGITIYRQYRQWIKPSLNENYRWGGFITTIGGLIIMLGCCGMPRGVNPNDKTVMINPPGAYHNGGVNENLTPTQLFWAFLQYISLFSIGLFNLLLYCKTSVSGHFTV